MKRVLTLIAFAGLVMSPTAASDFAVPHGFVLQRLDLANGRVARPDGWFYTERAGSNSVRWVIAKEDPALGSYRTGMSIQLLLKIKEGTGKTPREFVQDLLEQRKKAGELVEECPESLQGTFNRRCLELVEKRSESGKSVDYHLLYSFLWWDTGDILLVTIFGTSPDQWEATNEIRRVMSRIDLLVKEEERIQK